MLWTTTRLPSEDLVRDIGRPRAALYPRSRDARSGDGPPGGTRGSGYNPFVQGTHEDVKPRSVRVRFAPALALVLQAGLRLTARRAGLVVVYHGLSPRGGDPAELVTSVTPDTFASQLRYLQRHFKVVPLERILDEVRARRRGARFPVAVTLDDDLRSHDEAAAPILRRVGLPATLFLTGSSLDGPHAFWWERLQRALEYRLPGLEELPAVEAPELLVAAKDDPRLIHRIGERIAPLPPPLREEISEFLRDSLGGDPSDAGLRASHVRNLAQAGFRIGFHTLRHHPLPALDDDGLEAALREGRDRLAAEAGQDLSHIAYPHGLADERVGRAAREAGYALGFTTRAEAVVPRSDPLLLGRLAVWELPPAQLGLWILRAILRARP